MGLSPVMEIRNAMVIWSLIEEDEGLSTAKKDERKHADKKGFMVTIIRLCVQCVL